MQQMSVKSLRVPPTHALALVDTLRAEGIDAQARFIAAKVDVAADDLERVCAKLEAGGISYLIEPDQD